MEDFNHFLIRNLSEIVIVETNRSRNEDVIEHVGIDEDGFKAVCDAEFAEIERRRERTMIEAPLCGAKPRASSTPRS
jgi:predicted phosphoribosyltransferase